MEGRDMPLLPAEKRNLFARLQAIGWTSDNESITAPHRTMWLNVEDPWTGDIEDFRERMRGRLERMGRRRPMSDAEALLDWQQSYDDTAGLVKCLQEMTS